MGPLRTRLGATAAAALLAASVLGACSGGETAATSTPGEVLAAAKQQLDETSGVRVGLSTERLPPGVSGLLDAQGVGTHAPAFAGDITVAASGVTVDAEVVAVDGQVYAKLPFTTQFRPIDPADYGAPDPAALMRADGGLSSLLTAAEQVEVGEQVREGKTVLRGFTATVPGAAVAAVIPSAEAAADFSAVFTVDDDDRLSSAVLSGPFYPEVDSVTYTVTFDDYGSTRTITAPSASAPAAP